MYHESMEFWDRLRVDKVSEVLITMIRQRPETDICCIVVITIIIINYYR